MVGGLFVLGGLEPVEVVVVVFPAVVVPVDFLLGAVVVVVASTATSATPAVAARSLPLGSTVAPGWPALSGPTDTPPLAMSVTGGGTENCRRPKAAIFENAGAATAPPCSCRPTARR